MSQGYKAKPRCRYNSERLGHEIQSIMLHLLWCLHVHLKTYSPPRGLTFTLPPHLTHQPPHLTPYFLPTTSVNLLFPTSLR